MDLNLGLKMALKLILLVLYQYAIKNSQCLNINVITLVVYATNNKFMYYGQKPAKNPMQKLPKNPWQKSAWVRRIFQSINKTLTQKSLTITKTP
jgi:hypothetical protein